MNAIQQRASLRADPSTPNVQQALVATYLLQDWLRLRQQTGESYGPSWFARHGVLVGISSVEARKSAIRLVLSGECVGCGEPVPLGSDGDHLLPLAGGGSWGLENYIPLCARCNSSKGDRDFLAWWRKRGGLAQDIPPDVLLAYARLSFRHHVRLGTTGRPAAQPLATAVSELMELLPSDLHREAVRRRVSWVTGRPW